ncbi:MAG: aminopeptidase N [Rhizobiaceae bacterium]
MSTSTEPGHVVRLEDYRPSDYLIPETKLTFVLHPTETRVTAELTIRRTEDAKKSAPLVLDGDGIVLVSLAIDGRPAATSDYEASPQRLVLKKPPKDESFSLRIETVISPSTNTALMGLYQSNGVYCTQCEAEGFRRITYFLDRPDILSVYTVRVEANAKTAPLLLSNGNPGERGELPDGRHFAVWHDPFPKPSYLFALVAGDLGTVSDSFVTASGRKVALGIHIEHGKEARATYAMDALKRSMRWDEERFGCEYDLEVFNIVAVSDFIIGAMENKGLNIFNDKLILADGETATDADFAAIEAVVAHEYFHNWTGNRITCRDWFQLCLKEGLTVFRDHEFSADQRSRAVKRIAEVRTLRAQQFPEDQGPLAHPVRPRRYREINNFYTPTVYEKGSEIVRMIRTILGDDTFRAGMDLYLKKHDGDAATVENFLTCFEEASGRDLSQFALWYHQPGTPQVHVTTNYVSKTRMFEVELEQILPTVRFEGRKRLLHIPLSFGLIGRNGHDMSYDGVSGGGVERDVIHLRKRHQTLRFSGVAAEPTLSINRGFSAPVSLVSTRKQSDSIFLARNDSDLVNRWEALNALTTSALVAATNAHRANRKPRFAPELIGLFGEVAVNDNLEMAFRALALAVPSEQDIAREIGENIDPDMIHAARRDLLAAIATANRTQFAATYATLRTDGPFSPDAASAGRRALVNALLEFLSPVPGGEGFAAEHFDRATNMTDRMAALTMLAHCFPDSSQASLALAAFERRFADNALVMDKWFSVQAATPRTTTLERVRALTNHPAFSFGNPNRVRSLIGVFSTANLVGFNRADGAGYRFLAETVAAIDKDNSRLAARLATALRAWRSLEPGRRAKAREALSSLASIRDLSVDVRDIVERTLG